MHHVERGFQAAHDDHAGGEFADDIVIGGWPTKMRKPGLMPSFRVSGLPE
jgi:hypothetical protein